MKVLITGANGYIGKRLLYSLIEQSNEIVCLVRNPERFSLRRELRDRIEIATGDLFDPESLNRLPKDIDAAYYLVHSLGDDTEDLEQKERRAAANFRNYLDQTSAKQIVYLSGIANAPNLSDHLRSRRVVEDELDQAKAALTVLRAAIIIGSGSASFEIIRDLVEKLPVMITPAWLENRCQPVGVRDALHYLTGVLGNEAAYDQVFDIGGPDVLTYQQMLKVYAEVRGVNRLIFNVPINSTSLSSRWINIFSGVSYPIVQNLVASLQNEVVVEKTGINEVVPHEPMTYRRSLELALERVNQNEVVSSWKDSFFTGGFDPSISQYIEVPEHGCFRDQQVFPIPGKPDRALENIWRIGGKEGWYYLNRLWELRGFLDKIVGGVGLRRGRRSETELAPGDALDFWRVIVADKEERRLLLFAEMKLPGEAWLEFKIEETRGYYSLRQTATFRPKGVVGRLYWYGILPIHIFLFKGMAREIIERRPPQTPGGGNPFMPPVKSFAPRPDAQPAN